MKNVILGLQMLLALFSVTLPVALPEAALAQTAFKQPQFVAPNAWTDFGNGPAEVLALGGNGNVYTAGGGGTGTSAGTTALTLSATPAVAPCVGCVITCSPTNTATCTIPASTTVTAYNGTTGVTTSASTTVTAASLVWGAACPATGSAGQVPGATNLSAPLELRATAGAGDTGIPLYSTARICAFSAAQGGMTLLTFPIGAW